MADKMFETSPGNGGETHQHVPEKGPHGALDAHLTTNQGIVYRTIRTA
jgi:catalase